MALRLGNEIVWPVGEKDDASSIAVTGSPWSNVNVTWLIERPFTGTGAWWSVTWSTVCSVSEWMVSCWPTTSVPLTSHEVCGLPSTAIAGRSVGVT